MADYGRERYPMIGRVDIVYNQHAERPLSRELDHASTLCSLVTLLPDYLYRRYVQGKRLGKEITSLGVVRASVGHHGLPPSDRRPDHDRVLQPPVHEQRDDLLSHSFNPAQTNGRVAEIFVGASEPVAKGTPIFRLDSSKREAAVEFGMCRDCGDGSANIGGTVDVVKADGELRQANSERQQTVDELEAKQELYQRNPGNVPFREIERLQERERGQLGAIDAATATKQSVEQRISTLLPAEKLPPKPNLQRLKYELGKTVIRAGVSGRVEQFLLRVGAVVNPLAFPARHPDPLRAPVIDLCRPVSARSRLKS